MGLVPNFDPGDEIGDLTIRRRIGAGAFGVVYLAHDGMIGRDVALKVLPGGDERARQQVLTEARAAGRLSHPNIATFFRVHPPAEHDAWLCEIEYVPGSTLTEWAREEGDLPVDWSTNIAIAIAEAMAHAHHRGVIHGDIKPGNVLVTGDGVIKLVDFGLARILGDVSMRMSDSGSPRGTPLYMAPEVWMGEPATPRSDAWSFGALLYHMLAGHPPFSARAFGGLFTAIQNEAPEPLPARASRTLEDLVFHCLQKAPSERPESFDEIVHALRAPMVAATTGSTAEHKSESAVRRPTLVGQAGPLRTLEPVLEAHASGQGGAVLITGDAGVGKTALLRTIRNRVRGERTQWIEAPISPLHGLHASLLVALQEVVGIDRDASAFDISASAQRLIQVFFGEESRPHMNDQRELFWTTEQVLRALAERDPICLVVEDAQNANAEDRRLLRHLVQYLPTEGVLVLVACRTDESDVITPASDLSPIPEEMLSVTGVAHVALEPLGKADICGLIENELGTTRIAARILERIVRLAQGNPMLCGEFTRHFRESGVIEIRDGRAVPGAYWASSELPRRFRDLAAARLNVLAENDRQLLDIAAVDGTEFDAPAVAAVSNQSPLSVLRALQRIQRQRGLVRSTPTGFRFSGPGLRDVVYADLAPELRRANHVALAQSLEERAAEQVPRATPLRIGTHWSKAGMPERARPFLRIAVRDSLQRFEWTRATELASPAGFTSDSLSPAESIEHADCLLELGIAYRSLGRPRDAETLFTLVETAAADLGNDSLALRARVHIEALRYFHEGRESVDLSALEDALTRLPRCNESARAAYTLGLIAKYDQRYDDAERLLRQADEICGKLDLQGLHGMAVNELASVLLRRNQLRGAAALYLDAARIAEHVGQRGNAAAAQVNAAVAAFNSGELEGLVETLEHAIHLMAHGGARNLAGHARAVLANVLWAEGRTLEAEAVADDAIAILDEIDYLPGLTAALRIKAELRATAGDLDSAWALFERARELLVRSGNQRMVRRVHALEMLIDLWSGDRVAAMATVGPSLSLQRDDPAERDPIALDIAEGLLYGLPIEAGHGALSNLDGEGPEAPHAAPAADLLRLLLAWRLGKTGDLPALAESFLDRPLAYRRAPLRLAARFMAAVGAYHAGDPTRSAEMARDVAARARKLGHPWLELLAIEWLRNHQDGAAQPGSLNLRDELADRLRAANQLGRDPLDAVRLWLAPD
ncbi:MAG: protein kinase domain-containing protein [Planctomycetota bacterium]|jgi:tetratricopeptide (TPR) repeat protein